MQFHKNAFLHHVADLKYDGNRYPGLKHAYLTDLGLMTSDGTVAFCAAPVQIEDEESDLSASFRVVDLGFLKHWLKTIPTKGECLVDVTCRNEQADDGDGMLDFGNVVAADFGVREGEGAWPDLLSVLPDTTNEKEWATFTFSLELLKQLLDAFEKNAPVFNQGKRDVDLTFHVQKDPAEPEKAGAFLSGPGGCWGFLMPCTGVVPLAVREVQQTDNVDFKALAVPLPEDYFDPTQDEDETLMDDDLPDGEEYIDDDDFEVEGADLEEAEVHDPEFDDDDYDDGEDDDLAEALEDDEAAMPVTARRRIHEDPHPQQPWRNR